jgi:DNA-directed RNA polymerase specialized sigma24 family protein
MRGESLVSTKGSSVSGSSVAGALFARPEVRSAIKGALRDKGVPSNDLDDLTQEVLLRALSRSDPPETLAECVALARKMATDLAIDRIRQASSRRRFNVGLYEDPDDRPASPPAAGSPPEAIDVKRQVDFARRQIAAGVVTPRQAAIFEAEADDVPQTESARRLRVAFSTLRNDLARGRRAMRESWVAYAAAGLIVLVGLLCALRRDSDLPSRPPPYDPGPPHRHDITPPEPGREGPADALRQEALQACKMQRWQECIETFDRAAAMDPEGDADPSVQKARREAREHMAGR